MRVESFPPPPPMNPSPSPSPPPSAPVALSRVSSRARALSPDVPRGSRLERAEMRRHRAQLNWIDTHFGDYAGFFELDDKTRLSDGYAIAEARKRAIDYKYQCGYWERHFLSTLHDRAYYCSACGQRESLWWSVEFGDAQLYFRSIYCTTECMILENQARLLLSAKHHYHRESCSVLPPHHQNIEYASASSNTFAQPMT